MGRAKGQVLRSTIGVGQLLVRRPLFRNYTKSYGVPGGTRSSHARLPSVETLGLDMLSPSGTADKGR